MSFLVDKQTLDDLNILGRHKLNSIFQIYNQVITTGGRKLLQSMFNEPLTDQNEVNSRSDMFAYFAKRDLTFPFTCEQAEALENYLSCQQGGSFFSVGLEIFWKKSLQMAAGDDEYQKLNDEVCLVVKLLNKLDDFADELQSQSGPYSSRQKQIKSILSQEKLNWLKQEKIARRFSMYQLIKYDHLLRTVAKTQMKALIELVFELDVFLAVAALGRARGFSYAEALPREANILEVEGLYHPAINPPVRNDLFLDKDRNVIFLTGANMAGKSTLMKAFGICMYLAHMGFPIAANRMRFSIKDGLYSTINIPDNLNMGYSHFYAEVLRVKTVAKEVAAGKDLLVIFDELFKGTNVKDAYEATLSITEAFSESRDCFFVISTHITEVGESLSGRCANFFFAYLPTVMDGHKPSYTYKLTEGISSDKQGMMIIENEGILDILNGTR